MTTWRKQLDTGGAQECSGENLVVMGHSLPLIYCLFGGIAVYALSALWIIALAFRRNFWLGCVCVVFPIFQLVYVITNWRESHWAFYVHIGGYILILLVVGIAYFTGQIHVVNH